MDAPETPKINQRTGHINKPGQPYGDESWKALDTKIMGKQVRLDIIDIDRYKRMVGVIWIGNRNINLEMVKEGYAALPFSTMTRSPSMIPSPLMESPLTCSKKDESGFVIRYSSMDMISQRASSSGDGKPA